MPTKMGFLPVPASIAERTDLSPADKLVCGAIGKLQGHKASVRVKISTIANVAGLSARQVKRSIKPLLDSGAICALHGTRSDIKNYWVPEVTARNIRWKFARQARQKVTKMPPLQG